MALDFLRQLGASAGRHAPGTGSGGARSGSPMVAAAGSMGLPAGLPIRIKPSHPFESDKFYNRLIDIDLSRYMRICPVPYRSAPYPCIRRYVRDILVGMALPKRPPQRKPHGQHPQNALTPAFVRNVSRTRPGARSGLTAAGLALPSACAVLAEQPGALRRPSHREDADFGGDERRRDRDSRSDLARHAAHHPDGSQARQPVRPDRPGARFAGGSGVPHAGVAPSRSVVGDRDGWGVERAAGREAGVRVPGADGDTLRRNPRGALDGDRSGRGGVDHPGPTHEGGA